MAYKIFIFMNGEQSAESGMQLRIAVWVFFASVPDVFRVK